MKVLLLFVILFVNLQLPASDNCDNIKIKAKVTNTTNKESNGSLDITVNNGKPPYKVYLFASKRENNRMDIKLEDLINLPADDYILVIQDKGGCSVQENLRVK